MLVGLTQSFSLDISLSQNKILTLQAEIRVIREIYQSRNTDYPNLVFKIKIILRFELMASEMIAKGEKLAYLKPSCSIFSVEPESMICSSVTGETDNEDVSGNEHDPWNTGQGD